MPNVKSENQSGTSPQVSEEQDLLKPERMHSYVPGESQAPQGETKQPPPNDRVRSHIPKPGESKPDAY